MTVADVSEIRVGSHSFGFVKTNSTNLHPLVSLNQTKIKYYFIH
jgi:hypothetical protein